MKIDPQLIIPDKRLSINKGGLKATRWAMEGSSIAAMYMKGLSEHYHFSLDTPSGSCSEIIDILLYGTKGEKIKLHRDSMYGSGSYWPPSRASSTPGAAVSRHLLQLDQGGDRDLYERRALR